jgi:predicted Rossmann-fold nucleotide-binding protein
VLANVAGYYDPLLRFLDVAENARLIRPENHGLIQVARNAAEVLERIELSWLDQGGPARNQRFDELVK